MAKLTKKEKHIVEMYVKYFGRVATKDEISSFDDVKTLSKITAEVRVNAANESGLKGSDYLNSIIQNLFGRSEANAFESKYAKKLDDNVYYNLPIATIIKKGSKDDKGVYNAKKLVAEMVVEKGGSYELANINKDNYLSIYNPKKGLLVTTIDELEAKISNVPDIINGETYTLTTGIDTGKDFVGTNKNDLFLATDAKNQLSIADTLDGGKGTDTLRLIDNDATAGYELAIPVAASIKNIEIIDIIGNSSVTADTSDTTAFDGVTDLYVTSKTSAAIGDTETSAKAASTTNIKVTNTGSALTAETVVVDGGKDVTVISKNNALDIITVGATTAAAGKVSVTSTGADVAAGVTLGDIAVTGGTEIIVNQYAGKAAGAGNNIGGSVTVTGNASTTTVTVNQTATATGAAAVGTTPAVVGYTAGAVTVNDKNTLSTTLADTIETVTVKNAGIVTIDSGALKTLNLEGIITSVTATDATVKTGITAVDTLALNLKGVTTTAVTADADVKTLNIASSTTASTLAALNTDAKTVNISGDAALTLTALNNTAGTADTKDQTITVTNTAGVTISEVLDTTVTFTGGAGADSVIVGATTKTIDMGAGNDTVSIAAIPTVGSINGGAGDDKLIVTGNISTALAAEPKITGFEILQVAATNNTATSHNAHTLKALEVAGSNNTGGTTFTNVAAGVGLTVLTAQTATTVNLLDTTGTADVFNLKLSNATAGTQAAGTVTIAGVENINITTVDAGAATAATVDTITLVATSATSVAVSGNNGLDFTGSTLTKVTNFDASAVVGNDTTDTAAGLAVTFVSANVTVGAAVSIKGGAGNDTLTGTAQANDTIIGGKGADTITYTGGKDSFTGGEGNDTFVIAAGALGTTVDSVYLTIQDLTKGDKIDVNGIVTGNSAVSPLGVKVAVGSNATFNQALDAAAAGDGSTNGVLKWFQFENNTYLVVDNSLATTYVNGADSVIKITGLVDLSTSTSATDVITIA